MSLLPRAGAVLALTALLAGCRIDVPAEFADTPEGYHRMADGTLMADMVMETEFRDIMGDGVELATHTLPDGTVLLGAAPDHANGDHGGHDHDVPSPDDFPQGVVPIAVELPRLDVSAPVVATTMDSGAIQGPPVAGDLAWLSQTRRPGEIGPAIIGGVTAIGDQPGAFADLDDLTPGDEFVVVGEGGELLPYAVASTRWSPVADRTSIFAMGEGRSEVRLVAWATDGDADYVVSAYAITSDD